MLTNVDRTARNTNMLFWNKELWLIDHGAALYFHHNWPDAGTQALEEQARRPFVQAKDHVLLPWASRLAEVHEAFKPPAAPDHIRNILALSPDEWLANWSSRQPPD